MEYAHLGRSGLSVSRLCLGTMNFGPLTPPAEAHAGWTEEIIGLDDDVLKRLDELFPGYRPAPEHYAW
jgi:hypothetical protein